MKEESYIVSGFMETPNGASSPETESQSILLPLKWGRIAGMWENSLPIKLKENNYYSQGGLG
jgi:hypothetical protein